MMEQNKQEPWQPWIDDFLKWAKEKAFYGKLTLHFEAGKLVHLKREETLKPPKDGKQP